MLVTISFTPAASTDAFALDVGITEQPQAHSGKPVKRKGPDKPHRLARSGKRSGILRWRPSAMRFLRQRNGIPFERPSLFLQLGRPALAPGYWRVANTIATIVLLRNSQAMSANNGKRPMRRPARAVTLDDISGRILGNDDPDVLSVVIRTHLALEALLMELHRTEGVNDVFLRLPWPHKTARLVGMGLIDFAHVFGHRVDLGDVSHLVCDLASNGVDFGEAFGDYSEEDLDLLYATPFRALEHVGCELLSHTAILLYAADGRDIFGFDVDASESLPCVQKRTANGGNAD